MLTEGIVPPPEVSENFGLSGLLLLKSFVAAVEIWEGCVKGFWMWVVPGSAVGLEVAAKLKAELVKTSLLAVPGLTVIVGWGGWISFRVPPLLAFVCVVDRKSDV